MRLPGDKRTMRNVKSEHFELVVIGAGPGGYAAAFHAAQLGLKVALVNEEAKPGGVCLHRGCIPSKALLHVSRLLNETREAKAFGVDFGRPRVDIDAVREWKNGIVDKLTGGIAQLSKARGVRLIEAYAVFEGSRSVRLQIANPDRHDLPEILTFNHAILATGSRPSMPEAFRLDDPRVMDSTDALNIPDIPRRLLVVGGGYIGLELGSVYAALGAEVTVVEMTDELLAGVDRDLVKPLAETLAERFKAIGLLTRVDALTPRDSGVLARLTGEQGSEEAEFDRVLIAVERQPCSNDIGLEKTRVMINALGFAEVDAARRTADPSIYAIGDVAGEPMLAHKASREGKIAVEAISGQKAEFDNVAIPAVVFTDPEVAWCGLTETEANRQGRKVKITRFPWAASGRAATLGRPHGLTKIIFDAETERILGMGITGYGAGDLISEGVIAVEMGAVARDLAGAIHPHPTLSETLLEAAEALFGEATHIVHPKN